MPRSCWILLELLTQLVYHHAKVFRLLAVVRSPDGLQQFLVRQRLSLLSDEKPQDIEGVVVGEEIYLVQARPQQGLPGKEQ